MRSLFFVFIIMFSVVSVSAQQSGGGKLIGTIVDSTTREPLIGVSVVLERTTMGGATGTDGSYLILKIPPGTYSVSMRAIGYRPVIVHNVVIRNEVTTRLDTFLTSIQVELKEVAVSAERVKISTNVTHSIRSLGIAPSYSSIGVRGTDHRSGRKTNAEFNTEEYDKIDEGEFLASMENPLSTFSIDVDAASYANMRRFINQGSLPPPDAVRTEELINYFTYDYPEPTDGHPFSVSTEVISSPWNSENQLLLIGLQAKRIETAELPPSNLVFLLDVSGSMNDPAKLPLVKSAFRLLIQQLRPQDKVAVVVYAGNSGLVLPSTSGAEKDRIMSLIDRLEAGGSTAGGEGIILAYRIAKENFLPDGNNRVILATDGDFNVGLSSDADLERLIEEKRKDGIFLSVLGFGTGNYKDSKMELLADKGNGNYSYIDNIQEANKVFVGQMAGTLYTLAKDVKLQIEFNPAKVKAYRLIGYENRMLSKEDFTDDLKDAGDMGSGHSVTALYELVPANSSMKVPVVDSLKYQRVQMNTGPSVADEIMTLKVRYKSPKDSVSKEVERVVVKERSTGRPASGNITFAAAVAEFSMLLRNSKFKGTSTYDHVLRDAARSKGNDPEGYRSEFIRLVKAAQNLPPYDPTK